MRFTHDIHQQIPTKEDDEGHKLMVGPIDLKVQVNYARSTFLLLPSKFCMPLRPSLFCPVTTLDVYHFIVRYLSHNLIVLSLNFLYLCS